MTTEESAYDQLSAFGIMTACTISDMLPEISDEE